MRLPSDILAQISAHAVRQYPDECCGVLVGDAQRVLRAFESANQAPAPERSRSYALDPRVFLQADRHAREEGLQILGFYHSHPDHPPHPSSSDAAAAWEGYAYLILAVDRGAIREVKAWRFVGNAAVDIGMAIT